MRTSLVADAVDGFTEMTTTLWWLSVAFFGVGDLVTTAMAGVVAPLVEGSPTVGFVLTSYGFAGFVALKLLILALGYLVWSTVGDPHNVGVPLALSVLGVGFTTWNLVVIGSTLSV